MLDFPTSSLFVDRDVLGTTWSAQMGKHAVNVRFPAEWDDFIEGERGPWDIDAIGPPSAGYAWDPDRLLSVNVVRVTVEFDEENPPYAPAEPSDDPAYSELVSRGAALLDAAEEAAAVVLHRVLSWARVKGPQAWLGLAHEVPKRFGRIRMFDVGNPTEQLAYAVNVGGLHLRDEKSALSVADVTEIFERVRKDEETPIAEGLLADSQHFAWYTDPPDSQRAVLMAAIACEWKVKTSLRESAPHGNVPLLDLLLQTRRPVRDFFAAIFEATLAASMADDEPELFRKIDRLFRVRNGIAHKGEGVGHGDAQALVRAATEAFKWVDAAVAYGNANRPR